MLEERGAKQRSTSLLLAVDTVRKATVVTRQKILLVCDRENAKHHGFLSYQTYYVTLSNRPLRRVLAVI
jgi:hypothetical protein